MINWKKSLVPSNGSLRDAIKIIDASGLKLGLVLDNLGHLKGIITDGDIRRAILKGLTLDVSVQEVMNVNFIFATTEDSHHDILAMMRAKIINHIPVLNSKGLLVDLLTLEEFNGYIEKENIVVLMAGGLGMRLRPLTNDCPKPMLKVGDKPILENILDCFIEQGFRKFYISVNYLSEHIEKYFGDGSKYNIEIDYIREEKQLGTAGALSLLPIVPRHPFIVMNGDLLTRVNFTNMLQFHLEHYALATMAAKEFEMQVPYGVVKLNGSFVQDIEEKPLKKYFVNGGIYTLSPEALEYIPENQYLDMPNLLKNLINNQEKVSAFPIREYWMDVGGIDELKKAQLEWNLDLATRG
jgi:dTDP-glucose pyrophosphorylase